MATITASTFTLGHLQVDGRRYVVERHTDGLGVVHQREYLAPVGADYASILAARAIALVVEIDARAAMLAEELVKVVAKAALDARIGAYTSSTGIATTRALLVDVIIAYKGI